MAAMTGTASSRHTHAACWPRWVIRPSVPMIPTGQLAVAAAAGRRRRRPCAWNTEKSSPAQKPRPSPESTTARTAGSGLQRLAGLDDAGNMAPVERVELVGAVEAHVGDPAVDADGDPVGVALLVLAHVGAHRCRSFHSSARWDTLLPSKPDMDRSSVRSEPRGLGWSGPRPDAPTPPSHLARPHPLPAPLRRARRGPGRRARRVPVAGGRPDRAGRPPAPPSRPSRPPRRNRPTTPRSRASRRSSPASGSSAGPPRPPRLAFEETPGRARRHHRRPASPPGPSCPTCQARDAQLTSQIAAETEARKEAAATFVDAREQMQAAASAPTPPSRDRRARRRHRLRVDRRGRAGRHLRRVRPGRPAPHRPGRHRRVRAGQHRPRRARSSTASTSASRPPRSPRPSARPRWRRRRSSPTSSPDREAERDRARATATVEDADFALVALDAYWRAAAGEEACGIQWWALAGISRVEGRHGTYGGAELLADGSNTRPIIGIPLTGAGGTAAVGDSDGGALDGDPVLRPGRRADAVHPVDVARASGPRRRTATARATRRTSTTPPRPRPPTCATAGASTARPGCVRATSATTTRWPTWTRCWPTPTATATCGSPTRSPSSSSPPGG